MASTREHMIKSIQLLGEVIVRLALDAIAPSFWADKPDDITKLASRVWPLIEGIISDLPGAFTEEMRALNKTVIGLAGGELGILGSEVAKDWTALLTEIFATYRADLAANKQIDPAKVDQVVSAALARSSFLGVGSRAVTVLFELFLPKQLNFMNWLGPTLAQLSGYEQIVAESREPQYKHAFGNLAEYDAAQTFRTRAPEGSEAEELRIRGLITPEQYRKLIGWSGLMTEFEDAKLNAAYRPVSVRALATAYVDVDFPEPAIRELLHFTGNRPGDIDLLVGALKQRSLQNVRGQYLTALITATERGDLTDAELDRGLTTLEFSDDARSLVHLTVATRKLQQLNELYRKSVSDAYRFGQITDAEYVPQLEAIGIAEADANAHYAIDSILKRGRAAVVEARAEEKAAAQKLSAAVRAALAEYDTGVIDDAALALALAAAGLPPDLVAYAVLIAQARRRGKLVRVYGLLEEPAAAEELRRKVAAIGEQTVRKLITPADAIAQLAQLGIAGSIREALASKWAAQGPKLLLPP